jgi:hypothetical protein
MNSDISQPHRDRDTDAAEKKIVSISSKEAQFKVITRAAGLVLWASIIMTVMMIVVFWVLKGIWWGLGALEGGGMVAVDLAIFKWFTSKVKPGPSTTPLWKTVVKFYLVSIANMIVCFLVIKFRLGAPLAFLAGLGIFLPAITSGLIFYVLRPELGKEKVTVQGNIKHGE